MAKEKTIEQPGFDLQEAITDVMTQEPSEITFMGKRRKLGWISYYTEGRFSKVMVKEKDPYKRNVKACALLLLNSFWVIKPLYWLYWRWLYYVKECSQAEVLRVLDEAKKKIQSEPFSLATILATAMMNTMMTMRKQEAERSQAVRHGAPPTA